jgi:gliding motility-associated protein GldL
MKKLDVMNFFYSIGAVVILIGVIAKFLEWKSQDALLLAGLSVEALVFTFSSIQQKSSTVVYKWENIFPELVENENAKLMFNSQERYSLLMSKYFQHLEENIAEFNSNTIILHDFNIKMKNISAIYSELGKLQTEVAPLIKNIELLKNSTIDSHVPIEKLKYQISELDNTLNNFNQLGTNIFRQFKKVDTK